MPRVRHKVWSPRPGTVDWFDFCDTARTLFYVEPGSGLVCWRPRVAWPGTDIDWINEFNAIYAGWPARIHYLGRMGRLVKMEGGYVAWISLRIALGLGASKAGRGKDANCLLPDPARCTAKELVETYGINYALMLARMRAETYKMRKTYNSESKANR